jgi:hypothetical protein
MSNKNLFFSLLFSFFAFAAIAQPTTDNLVEGDDGVKEAAERAKYLSDFHAYNANLNTSIGLNKLFHHHVDINRTSKNIAGVGKVSQGIDCYFEARGGEFIIKKIIILTQKGAVSATTEYVFDYNKDDELAYYAYNSNINNLEEAQRTSYYFGAKQLLYFADDGLVQPKTSYNDEIFKAGIDVLNAAEDFRLMVSTLIRIQGK